MATVYKVLGQSAPTATTNVDLYTVPAATSAVISTISVTNGTATTATFRIFIRKAGAAAATAAPWTNAIAVDIPVPGNSITPFTLGITLATTDIITVRSGTANALTFMAFGSELS